MKKAGRPKEYTEPLVHKHIVIPKRQYAFLSNNSKKTGVSINRQIIESIEYTITLNLEIETKPKRRDTK